MASPNEYYKLIIVICSWKYMHRYTIIHDFSPLLYEKLWLWKKVILYHYNNVYFSFPNKKAYYNHIRYVVMTSYVNPK